jgi:gliding motility-associated-like protein
LYFSQGNSCANADPFCTQAGANFPASVNTTAQSGPNYGCLATQPNPAWYYLQIGTSGNITIGLTNNAGGGSAVDIDFALWGPFTSATGGCLPTANPIDCSYDPQASETVQINNAVVGQFYLLLITNYANVPTNINAAQTGGGGATDCSILLPCDITGLTANLTGCSSSPTYTFSSSGTVTFTDPPTTGQLIVTNCSGQQQVFNPPFGTSVNYNFTNTPSNGQNCNITASFTDASACTMTTPILTPSPIISLTADCNSGGGGLSGLVTFQNGHPGANLIIQASDGVNTVQTSIPMPASSPQNYSLTGLSTTNLNYTLTYYFSDNPNCPLTQTVNCACATFSLNNVATTNETCPNSCNGTITISAPGANQFSINNGTTFQATNQFNNLCAGTYTAVATDINGCSANQVVTITSPSPLTATISGNTQVCIGGNTTLTGNASGGTAPYSYSWDNGITTAQNTVSPASNQAFCLTVTDANGCVSSQTCTTVTVATPMIVNASIDETICLGESIAISAIASGGDGGPYIYTWNQGIGQGQGHTVSPQTTTSYVVSVTDGCGTPPANDNVTITVITPPSISFTGDILESCPPLITTFTSVNVPSGSQCLWDFGNGSTSNNCGTATNTFVFSGCEDISLTVTTADGCVYTVTNTDYVCVSPVPNLNFSYAPQILTESNSTAYFTNQSSNATSYTWTIDTQGANLVTTEANPTYVFPGVAGFYEVCISGASSSDCPAIYCQEIEVKEDFLLFVPNAFTPNNDSFNDAFTPIISGFKKETYVFYVFNRWGQVVFKSTTPGEGWDGTMLKSPVSEGVYSWKIEVTDFLNEEHKVIGHVTLVY